MKCCVSDNLLIRNDEKKDVLLVDGYNIIGAWGELHRLKGQAVGRCTGFTY